MSHAATAEAEVETTEKTFAEDFNEGIDDTQEAPASKSKKKKTKEGKTKSSVSRGVRKAGEELWIPLSFIVSNDSNPRKTSHSPLVDMGYGIFEPIPESDKPTLISLARGDDEQQKTFVELVEKHDEDLAMLAKNISLRGQMQAGNVIKIDDNQYDIEDGLRRFLALTFYSLKNQLPDIQFKAVDVTDQTDHEDRALASNVHRKAMSPLEMAHAVKRKLQLGMNLQQAADALSLPSQNARNFYQLLKLETPTYREVSVKLIEDGKQVTKKMSGPDLLAAVDRGEIAAYRAREVIKAVQDAKKEGITVTDPAIPKRGIAATRGVGTNKDGRVRGWTAKELAEIYNTEKPKGLLTEAVREFIAERLQVEYQDFPTLQKSQKEAEKLKAEAEAAKEAEKAAKAKSK